MVFFAMILGSLVLLADGVLYILMGVCMLVPAPNPLCSLKVTRLLGGAYPTLFKDYGSAHGIGGGDAAGEPYDEEYEHDEERQHSSSPEGHGDLVCHAGDLCSLPRRMIAYLLLVFGFCRVISSFFWGCGPIMLGLCTCLVEIAMLCHEMMCYESMLVNRAMTVLLHNVAVSLLYIGCALPNCQ